MSKLTKRFVERITPDQKETLKFWDSELKGFGVVILPSGRRTYCVQYRNQQRVLKRLKIGVHGQITAEEARELAKKRLGQVAHGEDPAEEKKSFKKLATIKDLAEDYMERHGCRKRPRSLKEDQILLKNIILPYLGDKKVEHVSRRDIETIHLRLEGTPYQANRFLALLSKMFSLAVVWGWREENPVKGIERYHEEKRDRWLNEQELNQLWEVLNRHPEHKASYAFKLLILTGARKNEVFQATWDQFNLEEGVWIKPSHITKQKKREHLPLSEKAIEVLQDLKKLTHDQSSYLFPGKINGKPLQDVRGFWEKMLKLANLKDIRIHDLRHTHASHLVSSGLSLTIVGKLLGHTQAATTQRYAHLADEPLRQAAELFGSKVGKKPLNEE